MKKYKFIFLVGLLSLFLQPVFSQNKPLTLRTKKMPPQDKHQLDKAEEFYEELDYVKALPIYEKLYELYPNEHYIIYRLGMCYLNKEDAYDKAVQYFEKVEKKHSNSADVKFFLGKAYHLTYQFDQAIEVLKEYLKQKIIKTQWPLTEQLIQYCENGKELVANPLNVEIVNIDAPVNTEASEYVPVISSDEEVMLYTYMGKRSKGGFEDIFQTEKDKNGKWKKPEPLGDNINGYDHDACIALSPDGQTLFVYRDTEDKKGEIYYSRLKGRKWATPLPLLGEINTNHWEGSASLSADGRTIYFTSDKPAGLGGRDIYKATLMSDSTWGDIKNLGPTINTPYNDDAPFIHPDGVTLIFSSEGHNSMGNYDIFHSTLQDDGSWLTPVNIGFPINSPGRDTYYVLSADGKTGYYSSGRPGGKGQQDIYTVDPGLKGYVSTIAMLTGRVTLDDESAEAEVIVTYEDGRPPHPFNKLGSNSVSGRYLTTLPVGNKFKVEYKLKDFNFSLLEGDSVIIKMFDIEDGELFIKLEHDVPFYTKEFNNTNDALNRTSVSTLSTEEMIDAYGDKQLEGLIFRVQIAAYNIPANYNYDRLNGLGNVVKNVLDDNITRFTIGGDFNTLNEANVVVSTIVCLRNHLDN